MIIVQTLDLLELVNPTETTLPDSDPKTVAALHYKSSLDRCTPLSRHKAIERYNDEKLKHDCNNKVQLTDKYMGYSKQFLDKLTDF